MSTFKLRLALLLDGVERRCWGANGAGWVPRLAHWSKFVLLPQAGTWGEALGRAQGWAPDEGED